MEVLKRKYNSPIMTDKIITCIECGQEFTFTVGEQDFYARNGLGEPEHCMICRGKYAAMKKDAARYGKQVSKIDQVRQ